MTFDLPLLPPPPPPEAAAEVASSWYGAAAGKGLLERLVFGQAAHQAGLKASGCSSRLAGGQLGTTRC